MNIKLDDDDDTKSDEESVMYRLAVQERNRIRRLAKLTWN